MKKRVLLLLLLSCVFFAHCCEKNDGEFTFIVAADMREKAMPEYRTSQYFLGACEAIKKAGKGAFMVSPGDIDPPYAIREVISLVLGETYPWYPVVGNHELEPDADLEYLRAYNEGGTSLPNIVRKGPPGCEETTYSFDWGDNHFIVLNQYYDGQSDKGTDGEIVPELMKWLKEDLTINKKKYIFIFGHEPLVAIPDIDNGRIRHQGDSLDKYPKSSFRFHQLLRQFKVKAYFCGHTHNASVAKINGLWQIDVGHARGLEATIPSLIIKGISEKIEYGRIKGLGEEKSIAAYFEENAYEAKKILYYTDLTNGISYKKIDDKTALDILSIYYKQFTENEALRESYQKTFRVNANLARSTFLRIITGDDEVKVEIYRDDTSGGDYTLMHLVTLN